MRIAREIRIHGNTAYYLTNFDMSYIELNTKIVKVTQNIRIVTVDSSRTEGYIYPCDNKFNLVGYEYFSYVFRRVRSPKFVNKFLLKYLKINFLFTLDNKVIKL